MSLPNAIKETIQDSITASLDLFRVMIPVIIAVKILKELGAIQYLAIPLKPFMGLVGLPAEMGLVWATSIIVNIYTGIIVYSAMVPTMDPLSVAQVTTLASMILIAHSLPVECKVAQKCGVSLRSQIIIRMASALMLGIILHLLYSATGSLQAPSQLMISPQETTQTLFQWVTGEMINLFYLFCIILGLMGLMRLLAFLRVTEAVNSLLKPVLQLIGIGKNAATITVVGLTMGITYGSGLIIHEARSGALSNRDIFASLSLMGLSHAIIEDTLLMMLLGAHASGTLWARLIFSLVFVGIMMRFIPRSSKPQTDTVEQEVYNG